MPTSEKSVSEDAARIKRKHRSDVAAWKPVVARYQEPSFWRALWQIVNTLGSYVLVWGLLYLSLGVSWWLTVPLALLAGGLLVRVFIIFHDCGHGSFFRSRLANDICGSVCGALAFTPHRHWRWEHSLHHATSSDLDRRGVGDVWTLTVQEYLEASRWKRFAYRLARNPFVLFVLAPLYFFLVHQRFPHPRAGRPERRSVWRMNATVLGMAAVLSAIFGILPYLLIQLIILAFAGSVGIWLFYVQHQFEGVYWARSEDWDYTEAALKGSSFYKLPKVLQWFSGNIGFHHVHHLSPRIPNYKLQRCHESDPMFREVKAVTLLSSTKSLFFRLWDESSKRLVSFRRVRELRRHREREAASRHATCREGRMAPEARD